MAQSTTDIITLAGAGAELSKLSVGLDKTVRDARASVLNPSRGQHPAITYTDAFARMYAEVEILSTGLGELARRLNFTARTQSAEPPARPLEAVLADLRAEGHDMDLSSYSPDTWSIRTRLGSVDYLGQDATKEEREANRRQAEGGDVYGTTAIEVAEKRLADIREKREALAAAVALAATIGGVGACARIARKHGLDPNDFLTPEELAAQLAWDEPLGTEDAEAHRLAAEGRRREGTASEEGLL